METLYYQAISLSVAATGTTDIRVSHFLKFALVATTMGAPKSGSWCKWGHERIQRGIMSFNHGCIAPNACQSVILCTWIFLLTRNPMDCAILYKNKFEHLFFIVNLNKRLNPLLICRWFCTHLLIYTYFPMNLTCQIKQLLLIKQECFP